jgi:hypothetical protein
LLLLMLLRRFTAKCQDINWIFNLYFFHCNLGRKKRKVEVKSKLFYTFAHSKRQF